MSILAKTEARILFISIFCLFLINISSISWAGNNRMVEERVQELDEINKSVVKQIPDIPKDGRIEVEAKVYQGKEGAFRFDINNKKIISKKEGAFKFNGYPEEKNTEKDDNINVDNHDSKNTPEKGDGLEK